jgi:hypothetical protein
MQVRRLLKYLILIVNCLQVQRFATEVVGPKVRDMDEKESMDPSIIKGLFDQGVSLF